MEKYKTVVLKCAIVHQNEKDAAIAEMATYIEIQNEGAGPFVVMYQPYPTEGGMLKFDADEIEYVASEAKRLLDYYKEQNQ